MAEHTTLLSGDVGPVREVSQNVEPNAPPRCRPARIALAPGRDQWLRRFQVFNLAVGFVFA